MSFRTGPVVGARAFEVVRRSLLQSDGLPFADVLSTAQMQQAFEAEGVSFGERADETDGVVYTPAIMLWAILSQMFMTGTQRSCRAAVARVAAFFALLGRVISRTNTGAYCRARAQVPAAVVQRLAQQVAAECEARVAPEWLWHGRRVRLADGSTFSMADTPENQAEYPQPNSQAAGVGFPLLRAVALTSLATGMVTAAALGPYAGKETGETALLRSIFDTLLPGDVVLGDRYYSGWFMLALMIERGLDFAVRLHQLREADFRRGERLGPGDHIVEWPKPPKPAWLDQATYDRLPEQLAVREVRVTVEIPGFRTESLIVVTSLRDDTEFSREEIAKLYRRRWIVELHLRDIKSIMQLDVLRCKTPPLVRQELWTGLLAYNLIRHSILQSAHAARLRPAQLSFTATLQFLASTWLTAAVLPLLADPSSTHALVQLRLAHGRSYRVGHRPDRIEPRAIKRRPKPHALLTSPRLQARAALLRQRST